jgi:uncharacterized protein YlxW (UPF0749 family)
VLPPLRPWLLALPLALLVGGLAASAVRTAPARSAVSSADSGNQTQIVSSLLSANDALRLELERLDRQLQGSQAVDGSTRLEEMATELNTLRIANGSAAVAGPGVEALVQGEFSAASLRDLVNELKNAGAEAIGVNGQRLSLWSAIYQDEGRIVAGGMPVTGAATIEAIGDPATLVRVLQRRGGLVTLLERDGAKVTISERSGAHEIALPVSSEAKTLKFSRLPSQ